MFKSLIGLALKPHVERNCAEASETLRQTGSLWSLAEISTFARAGVAIGKVADRIAVDLSRPVEFILRAEHISSKEMLRVDQSIESYIEPIAKSPEETQRRYIREVQALMLYHYLVVLRTFQKDHPSICPPNLGTLAENIADLMEVIYMCQQEQSDPARVLVRILARQLADDPSVRLH